MENGKDYVAPLLRKRTDKSPVYFFYCCHCEAEANGYTISDIDNLPHPMALNVYCHGASTHVGIQDVSGFREMMVKHEYRHDQEHPLPYPVFEPETARATPPKALDI